MLSPVEFRSPLVSWECSVTVLDNLIKSLSRLPGVGQKSASRLAYYLLKTDRSYVDTLAEQIHVLKDVVKPCTECGTYTEKGICDICSDPSRDHAMICIVEQSQDVVTIESTKEYKGLFHVLGGAISPIDGIGPENLSIGKLAERIRKENVQEVIIATNPTVEGDTTALYLVKVLKELHVKTTRLALGLPVGGDLEYADRLTLARSLRGRTIIEY